MVNELSLFSGAGGGLLGSILLGWRTVGYVEFNGYCQRVIAQRITDGILPEAPIFGDIRAFISEGYAEAYQEMVDVITAGFPCQPFSVAGQRRGERDDRNMWPETITTIRLVRPRFCLLENVPGLISSGYFTRILGDLAESGYDARWKVISAAEVGAPHKRDRLWIVAYDSQPRTWMEKHRCSGQRWESSKALESTLLRQRNGKISANGTEPNSQDVAHTKSGKSRQPSESEGREDSSRGGQEVADPDNTKTPQQREYCGKGLRISESGQPGKSSFEMADTTEQGLEGRELHKATWSRSSKSYNSSWWAIEPDVGRVVDGIPFRVDRLKALGDGQVPQVVATAWEVLSNV